MSVESGRVVRKRMQDEIARLRQGIVDMRDVIVAETENCAENEIGSLANRAAEHLLQEHKGDIFNCNKCEKGSSKSAV